MSSDDRQPAAAPESGLVAGDASAPAVPQPEQLVEALRYLQARIREFKPLSVAEERGMGNAANLDPEFLAAGLHAAAAWDRTETAFGRSAEAMRQEEEDARRWDEVIRELRALTRGIAGANLKRRHRLGTTILALYGILGRLVPTEAHLRPYYDDMKRAYMAALKKRAKPPKR